MLWLGGEPFLRPGVIEKGVRLFSRNGAFTNGLAPIPTNLPLGVMVSVDGPTADHDLLRGAGAFERTMRALGSASGRLFHATLTRPTYRSAPALVEQLRRRDAGGVLFGTYSPRVGEKGPWSLDGHERASALNMVRDLRREHGSFVLNTPPMLEIMMSPTAHRTSSECPYRTGLAIALDHRLRPKRPCSYGEGIDCSRCGCVALYLGAAMRKGDSEARTILETLFQAH
jgi:MoaA/NifB/PqqE/SkfB family radical SAM enzyme